MITIYTALYPEAQELIRALSLKKDMSQKHFQTFSDMDNQIQLVITGASAIAAAAAVAEHSTGRPPQEGDLLINYGSCAGGETFPVGTVSLCNKITEKATGRTFYPDVLYRHLFLEAELTSYPVVQTNLSKVSVEKNGSVPQLADLEAAAIYQAGNYYYAPHQMLFVKVVTDHGDKEAAMPEIDVFRERMRTGTEQFLPFFDQLMQLQKQEKDRRLQEQTLQKSIEQQTQEWNLALCGSETMRAQLHQMLLYQACALPQENQMKNLYQQWQAQGKLPVKDRREGKKLMGELRRMVDFCSTC